MTNQIDFDKAPGVFAWYGSDIRHPAQVVRDPFLTTAQKREFLADWASDRRAVPDDPEFRLSATGALAAVDDILASLKALDESIEQPQRPRRLRDLLPRRSKLLMGEAIRLQRRRRPRDDDDDDPPPVPARAPLPRPLAPQTSDALMPEAA